MSQRGISRWEMVMVDANETIASAKALVADPGTAIVEFCKCHPELKCEALAKQAKRAPREVRVLQRSLEMGIRVTLSSEWDGHPGTLAIDPTPSAGYVWDQLSGQPRHPSGGICWSRREASTTLERCVFDWSMFDVSSLPSDSPFLFANNCQMGEKYCSAGLLLVPAAKESAARVGWYVQPLDVDGSPTTYAMGAVCAWGKHVIATGQALLSGAGSDRGLQKLTKAVSPPAKAVFDLLCSDPERRFSQKEIIEALCQRGVLIDEHAITNRIKRELREAGVEITTPGRRGYSVMLG